MHVCLARQRSHLDCLQDISWTWIIEQNTSNMCMYYLWVDAEMHAGFLPIPVLLHVVVWYREIILSIIAFLLFHKMLKWKPSKRSSNFGKSGCPLNLVIVIVLLGSCQNGLNRQVFPIHNTLWSSDSPLLCLSCSLQWNAAHLLPLVTCSLLEDIFSGWANHQEGSSQLLMVLCFFFQHLHEQLDLPLLNLKSMQVVWGVSQIIHADFECP